MTDVWLAIVILAVFNLLLTWRLSDLSNTVRRSNAKADVFEQVTATPRKRKQS